MIAFRVNAHQPNVPTNFRSLTLPKVAPTVDASTINPFNGTSTQDFAYCSQPDILVLPTDASTIIRFIGSADPFRVNAHQPNMFDVHSGGRGTYGGSYSNRYWKSINSYFLEYHFIATSANESYSNNIPVGLLLQQSGRINCRSPIHLVAYINMYRFGRASA
jgi:hypothetical protein